MSTANKLIYLNTTKTKIKDTLNCGGADITTETFREYPEVLYNQYVDAAFGDMNTVYDSMPKVTASGTSASLNNTVSCRLTTELGGNSYQGAFLPAEYQQVDYIQSNSTAYIDTGFKPKQNTNVEIKCEVLNSGTRYIFGIAGSTNRYMLAQQSSNNSLICDLYSSAYRLNSTTPGYENGVHILAITNKTFYLDGVSKGTYSGSDFTATENAYIGGANTVGGSKSNIYYCKIWDNGTLVRHMIPCYRISDSVIGMYDVVNNVFYTNTSTGTFGKGSNTTLPTPNYPVDINVVTGRNDINICGNNLLNNQIVQGTILNADGTDYTSNTRVRTDGYIAVQPNTKYFVSVQESNKQCFIFEYNDTTYLQRIPENWINIPYLFTTSENTTNIRILYRNKNDSNIVPNDISEAQLKTGIVQEINLGKNLFDKDSVPLVKLYVDTSNNMFKTSNDAFATYMEIQPNTTYTISKNAGQAFRVATSNQAPANNISILSTIANHTGTNITITTEVNAKYLFIHYFNSGDTGTADEMKASIQVEKSSTATSYAPYFTPIELCKIGDYQDEIVSWRSNTYLPSEYTQVEYLESTGTQYINTNLFPTNNTSIEIEAKCMSLTEGEGLFGSRVDAGVNDFRIIMASSGKYSIGLGDTYYMLTGDTDKNLWFLSNTIIKKNGIILKEKISNIYTSSYKLYMFAVNSNGNLISNGKWQLFKAKIYENNILQRNFIPCIRNLDSKPGLYDTVTQSFFVNQGTGEFTYGLKANKWYVYKEINKATFVGNATENWYIQGDLHYQLTCAGDKKLYLKQSGVGLTNYFVVKSSGATEENFFYPILQSGTDYVRIQNGTNRWADTAAFKAWLQNHNIDFYYPTSNPTYTEITYQLLINQLENLYNAKSISGQTNIIQDNTDLPFLLTVKAIKQYDAVIA